VRLLAIFLLLWHLQANASPLIEYFYDGDTVNIQDGLNQYKLRLTDIDAPERSQPYGLKSRRALMQFCKSKSVQVMPTGLDKYHRTLGKLSCGDQDASLYMVENGHAWFNRRYSQDGNLAAAESRAQSQHIGLWASKRHQPPWEWREKHPHNFAK
jgi:micrococcal nuclease